MPSDMQPLGDVVTLVSGSTPSKANQDFWGGTTPWISAKDMGDFWIEDSEDHLTEAGLAAASRLVPEGTILLLARGMTLHKRVPICRVTRPSTFNQDVKAVLPKNGLSPRFLPYLLIGNHDRLHERVDSAGHGTGRLNSDALLAFPVRVPSPVEQESIADIGEGIDDRLRLLRQANATLEAIATTLFKSWFIDHKPVRAKAEGREPESMDETTGTLFPASFEGSAIGPIPVGWRVGKLGDVCANPRGQAKPGDMPPDTPYIGLEHMPRKCIALDSAGTAAGLESGKFWFERNDVLFGKLRPYFHKVGLAPFRGVCSTDILVLRPTEPKWLGFVAMHASSDELISYTTQLSNGARMPRTSWHDVAAFRVAIPSDDIANAFNDLVSPLFQRIYANIATAKLLAEVRDTLLPRLINGKLRLPECKEELREMIA
ncbi:restriction endonuclease subunit S [Rubrivivax rivuli]|uniref:Restriction endonuclease subunit S n=1 Tax=Rubrivivax rivuli TaxID=1862385 RepID=A0A437RC07_9BURK|nr:restriction endonuclease subunit S [Rubrivivax rivuli]RVU44302.1 restriction endonuclease subunit S [Rubrivivax rivuli]